MNVALGDFVGVMCALAICKTDIWCISDFDAFVQAPLISWNPLQLCRGYGFRFLEVEFEPLEGYTFFDLVRL